MNAYVAGSSNHKEHSGMQTHFWLPGLFQTGSFLGTSELRRLRAHWKSSAGSGWNEDSFVPARLSSNPLSRDESSFM